MWSLCRLNECQCKSDSCFHKIYKRKAWNIPTSILAMREEHVCNYLVRIKWFKSLDASNLTRLKWFFSTLCICYVDDLKKRCSKDIVTGLQWRSLSFSCTDGDWAYRSDLRTSLGLKTQRHINRDYTVLILEVRGRQFKNSSPFSRL